jgi:hypothetical protein
MPDIYEVIDVFQLHLAAQQLLHVSRPLSIESGISCLKHRSSFLVSLA